MFNHPFIRRPMICASAIAATLSLTEPARAGMYEFSYTLNSSDPLTYVTASGTLTTDDTATQQGGVQVTGITGTRSFALDGFPTVTEQIAGLTSPDPAYSADNLLYLSGPYLDDSGLTYTLAAGATGDDFSGHVNISYGFNYNLNTSLYSEPLEFGLTGSSFTLKAVPEPASLPLLLSGVLALAWIVRRQDRGSTGMAGA